MSYYTSVTCGYINNSWITLECKSSYNSSEVKYVVDAWAQVIFTDQLKTVDGYSARLITKTEYEAISAYSWRYNSSYWY